MDSTLEPVFQGILKYDQEAACEGTRKALEAGEAPERILQEALIPAMREVGRLFEEGQYFLPEMLVAARAMKGALAILEPLLVESDVQPVGKVAIGTVQGDLHDIGKNLGATMLGGTGFEVIDLGADVKAEAFVKAVKEDGADVVAMSALLTTTMVNMKATVDALAEAGLRDRVKVMVGGAPLTDAYAREIGADGFAPDASRAAKLAGTLLGVGEAP